MITEPVVFVKGKADVYHVLSPWQDKFQAAQEYLSLYAFFCCGRDVEKAKVRERSLPVITNLRLCGSCKNTLSRQRPSFLREVERQIKEGA